MFSQSVTIFGVKALPAVWATGLAFFSYAKNEGFATG